MSVYIVTAFSFLLAAYGIWYFVFNIYEVKYEIKFVEKCDSGERLFEVLNFPVNLMGKRVPLRKINFDFEIISGEPLVQIKKRKNKKELFFTTKEKKGTLVLKLEDKLSLFPQKIEFNLADNL